jgi:Mg2+ and Co2+ transporter CorA
MMTAVGWGRGLLKCSTVDTNLNIMYKSMSMTTDDYKRALDTACREYENLLKQRATLDARIAQLAQSIGNLTRLCGYVPTVPWGLTDACRMVLKAAGHALTAAEMRAQLQAMGIDLSRYTNDLAAIHTILKRLTESGEVKFVPRGWEKPGYRWEGVMAPPPISRTTSRTTRKEKPAKPRGKK